MNWKEKLEVNRLISQMKKIKKKGTDREKMISSIKKLNEAFDIEDENGNTLNDKMLKEASLEDLKNLLGMLIDMTIEDLKKLK